MIFDIAGREIKIGQRVAICKPKYSELCVGFVRKVTEKGVQIEEVNGNHRKMLYRHASQVCIVEE